MAAADPAPPDPKTASQVVEQSVRGAAFTTLAGLFGRGAGLLTTLLVTHFVSKSDYGHANLALIIATLTNLLTLLSPQQALLTRRDRFPEAAKLVQSWAVWSGLVIALLLVASSGPLLQRLHEPSAQPLLRLYCVALVLERVVLTPAISLRYQLRFSELARVDLAGDLAYVGVTMGCALRGLGAVSLPLGMVARHLVRAILLGLWCRLSLLPPVLALPTPSARGLLGELLRYAWPIHLGAACELITQYMDNVVVGQTYSAAAQGLYAVGYTVMMTPCDTIAMYGATALVSALGLSDVAVRQHTYLQGLRYVSLLLFPISMGLALTVGTLEAAVLPPHWHGISHVSAGLAIGASALGLHRMGFAQLTALHRTPLVALSYGVQLLTFCLGLWLVTYLDQSRQHLAAVAWMVSLAFLLPALLNLVMSLRADRIAAHRVVHALTPPLLGTLVMGGLLWLLQQGFARLHVAPSLLRLGIEVAAGMALYGLYLRLLHPELWTEVATWLRKRQRST